MYRSQFVYEPSTNSERKVLLKEMTVHLRCASGGHSTDCNIQYQIIEGEKNGNVEKALVQQHYLQV